MSLESLRNIRTCDYDRSHNAAERATAPTVTRSMSQQLRVTSKQLNHLHQGRDRANYQVNPVARGLGPSLARPFR
jgi:hypothetical protein